MPASSEQQMERLKTFGKLKDGIETAVDKYRDFTRDELTNGQFAAQILMAIMNEGVAFYLDPLPDR